MADAIAYGWEMAGVFWRKTAVAQADMPGVGDVLEQAVMPDVFSAAESDVSPIVAMDVADDFDADEEAANFLNTDS